MKIQNKRVLGIALAAVVVVLGGALFLSKSGGSKHTARVTASKELLAWVDETLGGVEIVSCRKAEPQDDRDGELHRNADVVLTSRTGKPFIVSRLLKDTAVTGSPYWKKFEERLGRLETSVQNLDHRSCEIWTAAIGARAAERNLGSQAPAQVQ